MKVIEAINILKRDSAANPQTPRTAERKQALEMAIKALEKEVNDERTD